MRLAGDPSPPRAAPARKSAMSKLPAPPRPAATGLNDARSTGPRAKPRVADILAARGTKRD